MIYSITNPKGIDVTIKKLQTHLSNELGWSDIDIYGRVYRNVSTTKGLVPEAYISDGEYRDVLTNDSKAATVFFIEGNNHKTKEGVRFENDIKIVFVVNLDKLFPSLDHRQDMEAEIKAVEVLRMKSGFIMTELEKGIQEVFKGFNTEGIKLSDMQPYHVFSINGNITYTLNCF